MSGGSESASLYVGTITEITTADSLGTVRVAIDARPLQTVARVRGIGRYSRNLLAAFARRAPRDVEWTLLRLRNFPAADPGLLPAHHDIATSRFRRPELSMLALDPVLLSLELGGKGIDVYHSTQLSLPARRDFAAVVTIHDLAPLIWPAHYLRLPYSRIGHAWQYALARRADAVIAVSEATKRDVVGRLRVPEERVTVVPEAVDSDFDPPPADEGRALARARFAVPDRYVLYVGQFDPRKNVRGLLRAFAAAAERDKDLRLVIVGDLGKLSSHLRDALETERAPRDRVIVTGFVDEPTLAALYAGAECLLHAALLEGFGLTALEALAAGTPVVGYAGGAVTEVVGDAGLLVGSGDESALANALARFLADDALRASLRGRARARASAFSWDRAADETLSVYRKVAR
ncbi:MAG: glycosyltransferase family 4 protein [Chloroflexi bacterium]|nr:MAG: glycosyltransferase family 4 protein [Chloroflexota bacterium]